MLLLPKLFHPLDFLVDSPFVDINLGKGADKVNKKDL